ncbi:MAG: diaminopimelate epimerase, partial [Pseudomonadota bacterium]|nr:diaminopimelate epimerase [Pseudomonadota bacterium]
MRLNFTKMQGLGNDFMVVNAIEQPVRLSSAQIRTLSDRHFGIGFDQLLLVEAPTSSEADFRYRIFNADGLEVSQCGNGARCFARYVVDHSLINKNELRIETSSGIIIPRLLGNGLIEVDMGKPRFLPQDIPFLSDHEQVKATYQLDVDGSEYEISALSVGNPHAVLFVKDIGLAPVLILGPKIEAHGRFPEKVNVGFVQVIDRQEIAIRVFERGVGETL